MQQPVRVDSLKPKEFMEEYQAFKEMGLTDREIARAFGYGDDLSALNARLKRYHRRQQKVGTPDTG